MVGTRPLRSGGAKAASPGVLGHVGLPAWWRHRGGRRDHPSLPTHPAEMYGACKGKSLVSGRMYGSFPDPCAQGEPETRRASLHPSARLIISSEVRPCSASKGEIARSQILRRRGAVQGMRIGTAPQALSEFTGVQRGTRTGVLIDCSCLFSKTFGAQSRRAQRLPAQART